MNSNYNASEYMNFVRNDVVRARRSGLSVSISGDRLVIVNTVKYQYDMDHGIDPKKDAFAYSEMKFPIMDY